MSSPIGLLRVFETDFLPKVHLKSILYQEIHPGAASRGQWWASLGQFCRREGGERTWVERTRGARALPSSVALPSSQV